MDVVSLGFRTDLALLQLGGTEIADRGDHLVVRTPQNPTYRWGNFLLLGQAPALADASSWLERFAIAFPGADHIAIGIDGRDPHIDVGDFVALGLTIDASTVMTATAVHAPPRPNTDATYRMLASDDDWAQSIDLDMSCLGEGQEPLEYRNFLQRRRHADRVLTEGGHGRWFGAFLDGRLVSQMGLFSASPGLARFQGVETHPDARGRGLAGSLVHHVSRYGFETLNAQTLVMVADPDYLAIWVYRSVGFQATETQTQCEGKSIPTD